MLKIKEIIKSLESICVDFHKNLYKSIIFKRIHGLLREYVYTVEAQFEHFF